MRISTILSAACFSLLIMLASACGGGSTPPPQPEVDPKTEQTENTTPEIVAPLNNNPNAINGLFVYYADVAIFYPCNSDETIPVLMEGDYPEVEFNYTALRLPVQKRLYIEVEGAYLDKPRVDGEGTRKFLRIDKLLGYVKDKKC